MERNRHFRVNLKFAQKLHLNTGKHMVGRHITCAFFFKIIRLSYLNNSIGGHFKHILSVLSNQVYPPKNSSRWQYVCVFCQIIHNSVRQFQGHTQQNQKFQFQVAFFKFAQNNCLFSFLIHTTRKKTLFQILIKKLAESIFLTGFVFDDQIVRTSVQLL